MVLKIMLVRPQYSKIYGKFSFGKKVTSSESPPLGLCYIAAVLEIAGHEVRIIDGEGEHKSVETISQDILDYEPHVVGITATTPMINDAAKIAELTKKENEEIKTIVGGPHVTAMPIETLKAFPHIDIGVLGEGERTISLITSSISDNRPLNNMSGIVQRHRGSVVCNPPGPMIQDLDRLPFPARHLCNPSHYRSITAHGEVGIFTTMESSRGCPFQCIFCYPIFGRTVRFRSAQNIVDEMESVHKAFNVKIVGFVDDTMTINRKRMLRLCEEVIRRGLQKELEWGCTTRVDTIDEELLRKMRSAGCVRINYGIESGNPDILKVVKKGITLEQAERAVALTNKVGMETVAYFILGHPYETRETIRDTINFAKKLKADVVEFSIMTPFPGTELWKMIEKNYGGIKLHTKNWSEFGHYGHAVISIKDLSSNDLLRYQKLAFKEYCLSPPYIARTFFKCLRRPRKTIGIIGSVLAFIKAQV